jgi:small-conductance mechanosensitive channel
MIADTKPGRQFEIGRKLRERVKIAFDDEGIESPLPQPIFMAAPASQDKA